MAIQIDGNGIITGYQRVNNSLGSVGPTWFRNRLMNANFVFNSRGASTTQTAGQYGLDRWKAGSSGCTWSTIQVANARQITISSGTIQQIIEQWNIEGGTYCLSWQGTAQARVNGGAYGNSGMTVSLTAYTDTTIEFNTGTIYQPQFEIGTIPTTFEQRLISVERPLMSRYFYSTTTSPACSVIKMTTGTSNYGGSTPQIMHFPQYMRAVPTVTIYTDGARANPGNVMKNGSVVTPIASGLTSQVTNNGFTYWAPSAFTTVGDYATFFCDFDAEL